MTEPCWGDPLIQYYKHCVILAASPNIKFIITYHEPSVPVGHVKRHGASDELINRDSVTREIKRKLIRGELSAMSGHSN